MRHFFIDLENVRSYGLEGVLLLRPDDMVYVFYSDNANTLTIPTIESLNESPATVKYIKTNYIGANAMDFQIVTLLGATIERDKSGSFYIISHDNGFKSAVKFCDGYFQHYDIVTGVFANIILALNSENSVGTAKGKSISKADKNQKKLPNDVTVAVKNEKNNGNDSAVVSVSLESNAEGTSEDDVQKSGRKKRHKKKKTADAVKGGEIVSESENTSVKVSEEAAQVMTEQNGPSEEKSEGQSKRKRHKKRKNHSQDMSADGSLNDANAAIAASVTTEKDAASDSDAISEESIAVGENKSDSDMEKDGRNRRSRRNRRKHDRERVADETLNRENTEISDISANENDTGVKPEKTNADIRTIKADGQEKNDRSGKADSHEKNGRSGKTDSQEKNGRSNKNDSQEKNGRSGKTESSVKNDRQNNSDKSGRNDISDKNASAKKEHKLYGYIYSLLSDYLSESTIAMYASSLDEGIRTSKTKDDFHGFLKKKYDSGEAEALYKIVSYDFDDLKKKTKNT